MSSKPECVCALGAELGEGPVWSAREDALWFVDIKQKRIHRFAAATGDLRSWDAPAQPGFIAPLPDGRFIAGTKSGLYTFDPADGTFALRHAVEPEKPDNRLNDGCVDAEGRLWFGSMDDNEAEASGCLYRLESNGPRAMDAGYVITNGPALSPDLRTLYHTDTLGRVIYAFDCAPDGGLTNKGNMSGPHRGLRANSGRSHRRQRRLCVDGAVRRLGRKALFTARRIAGRSALSLCQCDQDRIRRRGSAHGLCDHGVEGFECTGARRATARGRTVSFRSRCRRSAAACGAAWLSGSRFVSSLACAHGFNAPGRIDLAALYLERFMNYGLTPGELRSGRPVVGIAQSGSDLNPCNRHHLELAQRVREGIRDAGGIALEFPTHPIFENCRRPTAALDRSPAS